MFKGYTRIFVMWLITLIASQVISATHQNVMTPTFRNILAVSSFLVLFVSLVFDFFKRARETSNMAVKVTLRILAVVLAIVTVTLTVGGVLDAASGIHNGAGSVGA